MTAATVPSLARLLDWPMANGYYVVQVGRSPLPCEAAQRYPQRYAPWAVTVSDLEALGEIPPDRIPLALASWSQDVHLMEDTCRRQCCDQEATDALFVDVVVPFLSLRMSQEDL